MVDVIVGSGMMENGCFDHIHIPTGRYYTLRFAGTLPPPRSLRLWLPYSNTSAVVVTVVYPVRALCIVYCHTCTLMHPHPLKTPSIHPQPPPPE